MAEIPLINSGVVLVDDIDVEAVRPFRWFALTTGRRTVVRYAYANIHEKDWPEGVPQNKAGRLYMHRLLMRPGPSMEVDHINGDGLDNRRSNLRVVCHQLNLANQVKQPGRSSRFKGVHLNKRGRWEAHIKINQRKQSLGRWATEEAAARAYDAAALAAWGEHARLNFPAEEVAS